jgi:hypothetical protein
MRPETAGSRTGVPDAGRKSAPAPGPGGTTPSSRGVGHYICSHSWLDRPPKSNDAAAIPLPALTRLTEFPELPVCYRFGILNIHSLPFRYPIRKSMKDEIPREAQSCQG